MLNKAAVDEADSVTASHFHSAYNNSPVSVPVPSLNAFSAFHLLRNYNQLLMPPDIGQRYRQLFTQTCIADEYARKVPCSNDVSSNYGLISANPTPSVPATALLASHSLLGYQPVSPLINVTADAQLSPVIGRNLVSSSSPRRQRGEKKPIPDNQKDDKYFERRRRNNQAAKKSRDARKMREDQIAFRATMLEHENAVLRAQILTLREEASSLRQMLIVKKSDQNSTQSMDHQINCR